MKISDLAKATETSIDTIRYYEREGLIPKAERLANNYRHYDEAHLNQLSFIRHCRSLDMSLDEIRLLLRFNANPRAHCGEVNQVVDAHILHVQERINSLQKLAKQLRQLRALCQIEGGECAILAELEQTSANFDASKTPACLHTLKHAK